MVRIILRLLFSFILVSNLIIMVMSFLLNENIYKKYGIKILKCVGVFILMVIAFYTTLALIGIS